MDFSKMTKEQRQHIILAGLMTTIVIYALVAFGVKPFLQEWKETKKEYVELQKLLDDGRRNVNRTSSLLQDLDSSFTNLEHMAEAYIAPKENAYSWVTEQIYRHARDLDIDVETISEYPANFPSGSTSGASREFGAYGVRMVTICGYNKLRELIVKFEGTNPLLVVSGIMISPSPGNYEGHRVQVLLEWPIWTSPEAERLIRSSDLAQKVISST